MHTIKDCKVSADVECRNCNKAGHLEKICTSHIFSALTAEQQRRRRMVANLIEQGENSSNEEDQQASALTVPRHVRNAFQVYRCWLSLPGMRALWVDSTPDTGCKITLPNLDVALRNGIHIDRTKTVELYHAAGGSMHVEGMANTQLLTVSYINVGVLRAYAHTLETTCACMHTQAS